MCNRMHSEENFVSLDDIFFTGTTQQQKYNRLCVTERKIMFNCFILNQTIFINNILRTPQATGVESRGLVTYYDYIKGDLKMSQ